jgi:predicted DNA-binding transcriptional regulator YafY
VRSSRLLAILLRLQEGGPATAADLADALEVSLRTVYRDVAALQAAGVPLWTQPGRGGGIHLLAGWRTRLDGLTGDEVFALFLAGAPGAAAALGLSALAATAQAKVLATLPPELRERAALARGRFHLDAPGWFHHAEPTPHLATVAAAVWDARPLRVTYGGRTGDHALDVDPLGLVLKAGTWYLVARSGAQVRTYRVGRIVDARAVDGAVARDPDFDLASWWAASAERFAARFRTFTCTVRVPPSGLTTLRHVVEPASGVVTVCGGDGDTDGDTDGGWSTAEVATESLEVAADHLCALGGRVEVVDPPELRALLADIGRRITANNA